jgi:fructose-1,6-bisphosphatase I
MNLFDDDLGQVIQALMEGAEAISENVVTADTGKAGTQNVYGEDQIAMDVLSEELLQKALKETGLVKGVGSEELDKVTSLGGSKFGVVYDPLDGSSLFDVNLSVGTIWGIFEGDDFVGKTPGDMLAAGFFLYGPRTTMMVSRGDGVQEFHMTPEGEWNMVQEKVTVGEGKMFAPGNLRATKHRKDYLELVNWWMENQYKLRYSGGMVPDINQILIKGKGIFSYPGYEPDQKDGKLRLLFECGPMAYLMEQAGGAASDGFGRILEKKIENLEQRSPIYVGSKDEVARCKEWLGKAS